jgi:Leucine-rich repeat (LRR) protein
MKVAVSIALAGLLVALPNTQVMAQDVAQEEAQEEAQVLPVLQPSELCSDQPDAAIATFEDANLEVMIRAAISVGAQDDLTCALISELTELKARNAEVESLVGIQNFTGLTHLRLPRNLITDISALSGLTSLTHVYLNGNLITDISALSGLASLRYLYLNDNTITDISALRELTSLTYVALHSNPGLSNIQPLLNNTGLGAGDKVLLRLTSVSCPDVTALQAKGVSVFSACS